MKITLDSDDVIKALSIYLILKGMSNDGYYTFNWNNNDLSVITNITSFNNDTSNLDLEKMIKYVNE